MSTEELPTPAIAEGHEKKKRYTKKKGSIWSRKQPRVHYGSPRLRLLKRKRTTEFSNPSDGEAILPSAHHADAPETGKTTGKKSLKNTFKQSNVRAGNAEADTSTAAVTRTVGTTSDISLPSPSHTGARRGRGRPKSQNIGNQQNRGEQSLGTSATEAASEANLDTSNNQERRSLRSSHVRQGKQYADVSKDLENEHFAAISSALKNTQNNVAQPRRTSLRNSKLSSNVQQSSATIAKANTCSDQPTEPTLKQDTAVLPRGVLTTSRRPRAAANVSPSPVEPTSRVESMADTSGENDLPRLANLPCNSLKLIRNRKRHLNDGNTQLAGINQAEAANGKPSIRPGTRLRPAIVADQRSPGEVELSPSSAPYKSDRFARTLQRDGADARPETNTFQAPLPPRRFDANRNRNTDGGLLKQTEAAPVTGNADADGNECRFELFHCNSVAQFGPQTTDARSGVGLTVRPTDPFYATRLFVRSADGGQAIGAVGIIQIRPHRNKIANLTRKPTIFSVIVADNLYAVIDGRQVPLHSGDYFFVGPQANVGFTNESDGDAILSYSQYASGCYVIPATASNVVSNVNDRDAYVAPAPSAPAVRGFAMVPVSSVNANRGRDPIGVDRRALASDVAGRVTSWHK